MEEQTYTIQGVEVTQGELTLAQDIQLYHLLKDYDGLTLDTFEDIGTVLENAMQHIKGLLKYLIETEQLTDFFAIILQGDTDQIDFTQLTNSEALEIVEDFFLLATNNVLSSTKVLSSMLSNPNPTADPSANSTA